MTQPSSRRFVMEDRFLSDLATFEASVDNNQLEFENEVNAKIAGLSGYNYVINGAMDFWQRGVGPFTSTGYCADRWKIDSRTAMTMGQYVQPFDDYYASNGMNGKYALEFYSTNEVNSVQISQYFESGYVNSLRGYEVTFSFYAKCRDFTSPEMHFGVDVSDTADSSTATFASIVGDTYFYVTETWQRYEATVTIPYDLNSAGLRVRFNADNIALDEHIQITDVKLERGVAPTPFTRNGGNLAGELAACQRYYQRLTVTTAVTHLGAGGSSTTTNDGIHIPLRTTMRIAPTAVDYPTPTTTYFYGLNWQGSGGSTVSAIAIANASYNTVTLNCTVTGATAGAAAILRTITTGAYIGFNAEL